VRQERFESENAELWERLEQWLQGQPTLGDEEVPGAYRRLCHHLALARERQYAPALHDRLQALALALHQRLYSEGEGGFGAWRFLARDYPALVRSEWRLVLLASILLFGSWLAAFLVVRRRPELVHLILSPAQAAEYARMYDPAAQETFGMRGPMRDVAMFGYYIWNNIGIDFQVFASGLVLGLGSVFTLLYNGLQGGAVMAHLTNLGMVSTFYGFVSGHSSFELLGASLSGAAGLRLGLAWIHPGRHSRLEALKKAGRIGARLVLGAALMTFVAAAIEGFWSANTVVPWKGKLVVGLLLWALLLAYFALAGRRKGARS
jgi:uncharacterized membrane protein SpoIIM required for sporulation